MSSKLSSTEKKLQGFFDYWKEVEVIKLLNEDMFKKVNQDIRKKILRALHDGIEDIHPIDGTTKKRRVLNAKEIRTIVETKLEQPVERANLYFHLNELEKIKVIQIVDALPEKGKRRYTAYYGRTAKIFLRDLKYDKKSYKVLYTPEFFSLIEKINPELTNERFQILLEKMKNINNYDYDKIISWFENNGALLNTLDIDLTKIFELLIFIQRFDLETSEGFEELAKLLNFNAKSE